MFLTVLTALVAATAVFVFAFLASVRLGGLSGNSIASRLTKYSDVKAAAIEDRKRGKRERTKAADIIVRTVDRAVQNQNFASKLRNAIARADLKFTVAEYLILWAAIFVGCVFLGQVVFRTWPHTII